MKTIGVMLALLVVVFFWRMIAAADDAADLKPEGGSSTPAVMAAEDAVIPRPIPVESYEMLWRRSPFEIPVAVDAAQQGGIAGTWVLASLSSIDGFATAILRHKSTGEAVLLQAGQTDATHQLTLVEAYIDADHTRSRALVRQGAETAELVFQDHELSALASLAPGPLAAPLSPQAGTDPHAENPPQPVPAQPPQPRRVIIRPHPAAIAPPPTS